MIQPLEPEHFYICERYWYLSVSPAVHFPSQLVFDTKEDIFSGTSARVLFKNLEKGEMALTLSCICNYLNLL
jgi:hypothetical protein